MITHLLFQLNVLQVKIHFQIQVCKDIDINILVFGGWSFFRTFNHIEDIQVQDIQQLQVQPQSGNLLL